MAVEREQAFVVRGSKIEIITASEKKSYYFYYSPRPSDRYTSICLITSADQALSLKCPPLYQQIITSKSKQIQAQSGPIF